MTRKGLGRGLDAILGSEPATSSPERGAPPVQRVGISRLVPNRFQPRASFDDESLDELAASIRSQGVIQPLVVAARADGSYTIIAGERRWRAAQRCGLTEVPVVVRDGVGDRELLELALVENLQRADLNAMEEADAYRNLQDRFSMTQEDVAQRVGRARTTITNSLRLLRLPAEVQDLVRSGRLSAGQARPLLALDSPHQQIEEARRAVARGTSARGIEALVSRETSPRKKPPRSTDVHTAVAEEKLTQVLQTRVEIKRRGKGGTVQVHFGSEEELIRLFERLGG